MFFVYFLFVVSFFLVLFYSSHYVYLLLLFELMLLSIFLFLLLSYYFGYGLIGSFFYLLIMVCMGGFSVTLLVGLTRSFGRDFWCLSFIF